MARLEFPWCHLRVYARERERERKRERERDAEETVRNEQNV